MTSLYTKFESDNTTRDHKTRAAFNSGNFAFTFSTQYVVKALWRTKECISPSPDNINGLVLSHCTQQLDGVLQNWFQSSTDCGTLPRLLRHSTVISIPTTLNNLRPVALTSLVMKFMERILKHCFISATCSHRDPDVLMMMKYSASTIYMNIRITPTLQPDSCLVTSQWSTLWGLLSWSLNYLPAFIQMNHQLIRWILDSLTSRSQRVLVNNTFSDLQRTVQLNWSKAVCLHLLFIL